MDWQTQTLTYVPQSFIEEDECERYPRVVTNRRVEDYSSREIGLEGENLAAHLLANKGYEILDRNWRCGSGEADIVALDGDTVVLVEVKTRLDVGGRRGVVPELAVDAAKRRRYGHIALMYLIEHPGLCSVRFDVIAITIIADDYAQSRHLVNAFNWED